MPVGLFGMCMGCMDACVFERMTSSYSFDVLHITTLVGGNSITSQACK
jgi:hypothetical protein